MWDFKHPYTPFALFSKTGLEANMEGSLEVPAHFLLLDPGTFLHCARGSKSKVLLMDFDTHTELGVFRV